MTHDTAARAIYNLHYALVFPLSRDLHSHCHHDTQSN